MLAQAIFHRLQILDTHDMKTVVVRCLPDLSIKVIGVLNKGHDLNEGILLQYFTSDFRSNMNEPDPNRLHAIGSGTSTAPHTPA